MKVPFLDLKAQYASIAEDVELSLRQVIDRTAFCGGPFVNRFEEHFAAFCGCNHAIGVGSGTDALWLAFLALGIGAGDEVITVPNSFIATAEAISLCGARPVFVDVDERSQTMNPALLEAAITSRTRAIVPVHLYGQMADMDPIMAIARKHGLYVVEDACQAHGALYKGRPAGSIGDAGCFSFYPGKNLGAYGEAGAVVTGNPDLNDKARMLRDHGQSTKYFHSAIGWNARMDGMQGAVLSVKLPYLTMWNDARRKNAALYASLLADIPGVIAPIEMEYGRHIYHVYSIRVQNRDQLMTFLGEKGIACGIHYPIPIHRQNAYDFLGLPEGSFPVAERLAGEILSLPMYPELTNDQIRYVAGVIAEFMASVPTDEAPVLRQAMR